MKQFHTKTTYDFGTRKNQEESKKQRGQEIGIVRERDVGVLSDLAAVDARYGGIDIEILRWSSRPYLRPLYCRLCLVLLFVNHHPCPSRHCYRNHSPLSFQSIELCMFD